MGTVPKIDSSRWTGGSHGKALPGLQGPSLYLAVGILVAIPLYSLLWHALWRLTGSPIVRTQASWVAVLAALVGGALMFLFNRNSKERWFWATAGLAATGFLSSLTFYVTDFLFANDKPSQRISWSVSRPLSSTDATRNCAMRQGLVRVTGGSQTWS